MTKGRFAARLVFRRGMDAGGDRFMWGLGGSGGSVGILFWTGLRDGLDWWAGGGVFCDVGGRRFWDGIGGGCLFCCVNCFFNTAVD